MRKMRADLSVKEKRDKSIAICNNFMGNIPFNIRDKIALYWPIYDEVDVKLLIDALLEQGHECSLPCVVGRDKPLIFREYSKGMELIPAKIGGGHLKQPLDSAAVVVPNIIVVPLLAFDILGGRLGYGGGFYDRTIAALSRKSDLFIVGVAYGFSQIKKIPSYSHDQEINCCVTENGVVIIG